MIPLHSAGFVYLSSHIFELIAPSDPVVEFSEIDSVAVILNFVHRSLEGKLIDDIVNDQQDKLILLSMQLTLGLHNAYLYEQVENLSRIDGLTGVFRRGYFETRLEEEISRATRFNAPLSLVMMDIDNFKRYNDEYGHITGDKILSRLADILKKETYESDFICRYGGEEFCIIMPLSPPDAVRVLCENLRERISREVFEFTEKNKGGITVSIGIAHYPLENTSKDTLLKASDEALYLAKKSGKNQVREYQEVLNGRSTT